MNDSKMFRITPLLMLFFGLAWAALLIFFFLSGTLYISTCITYTRDVAILGIIALSMYVCGLGLFNILRLECSTGLEKAIHCFGLGIGCIAYLVFILGVCGLLYQYIFYAFFGLCAIICVPAAIFRTAKHHRTKDSAFFQETSAWEVFLYCMLFGLLALTLLNSLAPAITYDTMVYHYGLPNIFIQNHSISYLPENIFSGFPQNIQMLFTLAILMSGHNAANLMHFGLSALFLLTIYTFAKKYFGSKTALTASVLLFSSPVIAHNFSRPATDMGLALFLSLGLFSIASWTKNFQWRWLIAAACYTGLALGTKYTALFYGLALFSGLITLYLCKAKHSFRSIMVTLLIFLGISIIIASPWYIKNWLTTGNPFFPAFHALFGGEDYSSPMALRQLKDARAPLTLFNFDVFKIPFSMLTKPYTFGNPAGPAFLFVWPFLFLIKKRPTVTLLLIVYCITTYLLWACSFRQIRFFIAPLGAFAILSGFVFETLRQAPGRSLRVFASFCAGIFIIANTCTFMLQSRITTDPLPVVFGAVSKEAYLKKHLSVFAQSRFYEFHDLYDNPGDPTELTGALYSVIEFANTHLNTTNKVLFFGETMHAYLTVPYLCNSAFNRNPLIELMKNNLPVSQAAARLKTQGFTHIIFNPYELKRLRAQGYSYQASNQTLMKIGLFMRHHTNMIFKSGNIILLEIAQGTKQPISQPGQAPNDQDRPNENIPTQSGQASVRSQ